MSLTANEILYPLLPSFYQQLDLAGNQQLRALLALLEGELRRVDADISHLYENWFIETCDDWVVPYIAQLLGVQRLPTTGAPGFNQRTYVANVLSYRRRKGTSSLLLQFARDMTAWPVHLVEFFREVSATQNLLMPQQPATTVDLRLPVPLRRLDGPFNSLFHTAEVRNIPLHSGRYNLPSVGLFLWRLRSYRVPLTSAGVIALSTGRFTFDPLGRDLPLFNPDRTQAGVDPQESDVPAVLTRRVLTEDLLGPSKTPPQPLLYFGADPVVQVYYNGNTTPLAANQILIADLSVWAPVFPTSGTAVLAIDPELGRLAFSPTFLSALAAAGQILHDVKVRYNYGYSADLGGGPYERQDAQAPFAPAEFFVCRSDTTKGDPDLATALGKVATRWANSQTNPVIVEIVDSELYAFPKKLSVPAGMQLVIRARNYSRPAFTLDSSTAPVMGAPPADSGLYLADAATLTLDGLLFGPGILRVYAGDNNSLTLRHCTLVPTADSTAGLQWLSLQVQSAGAALALNVQRSITGSLGAAVSGNTLAIADSILDGAGTAAVTLNADSATIERSTVLGQTTLNLLPLAGDSIFTNTVVVKRTQPGCVRFCYMPSAEPGAPRAQFSVTPPRYRCQPDGALSGVSDSSTRVQIRADMKPVFTSTQCGQPGYAQLAASCPAQIARGGSDESEMGAFFALHQPQRLANLNAGLQEFLRFGYEAGVFLVN